MTQFGMVLVLLAVLLVSCSDYEEEALAAVEIGGKYGFINPAGEFVIKPQFDYAVWFSDGVARVEIADKYGYINKAGEYVIKPQYLRV